MSVFERDNVCLFRYMGLRASLEVLSRSEQFTPFQTHAELFNNHLHW